MIHSGSKRILGAVFHALHAKDAFRSVLALPRIVRYIHVHGAYVLAESTVILKCVCKRDTCYVIGGISADESPEHDPFDVADPGKEQCPLF